MIRDVSDVTHRKRGLRFEKGQLVEFLPRKKTVDFDIYIYIYHHHVVLVAWISLTLSRHFSLSFIALGRSSGQHPVSSHSC